MNYDKTKAMITKLITIADGLRYGYASVTVKKHDGRVVQVSYSTQENTREQGTDKDSDIE